MKRTLAKGRLVAMEEAEALRGCFAADKTRRPHAMRHLPGDAGGGRKSFGVTSCLAAPEDECIRDRARIQPSTHEYKTRKKGAASVSEPLCRHTHHNKLLQRVEEAPRTHSANSFREVAIKGDPHAQGLGSMFPCASSDHHISD